MLQIFEKKLSNMMINKNNNSNYAMQRNPKFSELN